MISVAKLPAVHKIAFALTGLALSCSLFFAVAPRAHAAGLTQGQISAIVSLLQSFGADQATINNVQAALGGTTPSPSVPSPVLLAQPGIGSAPLTVTFRILGYTPGQGDFLDINGEGQVSVTGTSVQHTFNTAGVYTAALHQCILHVSEKDCDGSKIISNTGVVVQAGAGAAGTIAVSAGTQPVNGLAPQATYIKFTTFVLKNTGTAAVTVSSVTVQRNGAGASDDAAFAGVYVGTASGGDLGNVSSFNSNHVITLPMQVVLQPGETETYTVSGMMAANLSAYASDIVGFSVVGVNTSAQVSGALPIFGSNQTLNALNVCSNPAYGFQCWFTANAGSLSVSLDASSPSYGVVAAGSTGVVLGAFKFTATSEAETLRTVSVALDDGNASPSDLVSSVVTIWDGGAQVGSAVLTNHKALRWDGTATLASVVTIPQNGSKILTLRGSISNISVNGPITKSGDVLSVAIDGATATGVSSGSVINNTFSSPGAVTTQFAQAVRIYKSFPTFTYSTSGGTLVNGQQRFLTLNVTADPHGDIQLGHLNFSEALVGATVNGMALVGPSGLGVGGIEYVPNGNLVSTSFNSNSPDSIVPAGQTKTYYLTGAAAFTGTHASAAFALKADSSSIPLSTVGNLSTSILWSPLTQGAGESLSSDWTNSYGLGGCYATSGLGQDCFANILTGTSAPTPTPASATIDQSSLTSSSGTPTITGTAQNVGSNFGISIGSGSVIGQGDKEYGSGNITVVNGRWSATVSQSISNGTHNVQIYNNNVSIASGILTISTPTPTPTPSSLPTPTLGVTPVQQYNGSTDYTTNPSVGDSQAFTISAWIQLNGNSCSTIVSDGDNAGGNDLVFAADPTHLYVRADKSSAKLSGSACSPLGLYSVALPTNIGGSLHQVAWVNSGDSSTLYLDGSVVQTVAMTGSNVGYHNSTFTIGRMWDGANGSYRNGFDYFNGTIQAFKYYNSALSASQISQIYSAGSYGTASAAHADVASLFVQNAAALALTAIASPFALLTDMLGSVFYAAGWY